MLKVFFITLILLTCVSVAAVSAQQPNPVERQVANPITDTPNVNPISAEQSVAAPKPRKTPSFQQEGGDSEVVVYSDKQSVEGPEGKRVVVHEGNVDVRYGIYRLQADKITIFEAENKIMYDHNSVTDEMIWSIIINYLETLKVEVDQILQQ